MAQDWITPEKLRKHRLQGGRYPQNQETLNYLNSRLNRQRKKTPYRRYASPKPHGPLLNRLNRDR